LRSHLNEQTVIPLQLLEGILQQLLDRTGAQKRGSRDWMGADMRAEFMRLVQYCKQVLRKDDSWLSQHELGVDFCKVSRPLDQGRII
jgi:hypothetical protein